jgi:uncharacterized SAM-binding protein YcdF (DUF218 family)
VKRTFNALSLWGRRILFVAGSVFLLQIALVLTGPPQRLADWLNGEGLQPRETPRYIVVLGGGGIPSGSSLLRLYHAALFGRGLTGTTFIVSLPTDTTPDTSSVGRMRDELVMRGIPASAIRMETRGLNTHEQAVNIYEMLAPQERDEHILVVTSDYHVRRAVLSFRKAGFTHVDGLLAYSTGAEGDVGLFAWLRYTIWGNSEREIRMLRELSALLAYKLKGWV